MSLLFTYGINRFSHDVAHTEVDSSQILDHGASGSSQDQSADCQKILSETNTKDLCNHLPVLKYD